MSVLTLGSSLRDAAVDEIDAPGPAAGRLAHVGALATLNDLGQPVLSFTCPFGCGVHHVGGRSVPVAMHASCAGRRFVLASAYWVDGTPFSITEA